MILYSQNNKHSFKTRPGDRSGLRLGFRILTGSPDQPGQFFFLNQNDVILVKKQKSTGLQPGRDWVAGSTCRVTPGFSFPRFFFNLDRFQPRINPSSRAGFKTTTRRVIRCIFFSSKK